ncbi:MAG: 3-isopropylmalate dehydratase small subunit [Thermodesulfobacteriota bacterium]
MQTGRIWKLGDNIDTDQIIPSQYLLLPSIADMKIHTFESLVPDFATQFQPGDVIVAGENFGCGSSREQAPRVLQALGASAVIAKSFARIFFRNSINIGLPLIVSSEASQEAKQGDSLFHDLEQGIIEYNQNRYVFSKFPEHVLKIIHSGGLINFINSHDEKAN